MQNLRVPGQDVRTTTPVDDAFETGDMAILLARGRRLRAQAFNHAITDVVTRIRHLVS
ncbi:MAG: hypothetical protein VCC99_11410 [Alphaproteobacteria bacterium]